MFVHSFFEVGMDSPTNRNLFDQLDSNLQHLTENVQEIKKSTEEVFPKDINELNIRLKYIYSMFLNSQSSVQNSKSSSDIDNSTINSIIQIYQRKIQLIIRMMNLKVNI